MSNVLIPGRFVVCAANRYGDLIVCGARHFDKVMHSQLKFIKEDRLLDFELEGRVEEGFIDQFGAFMSRTEAWQVAEAAGQIIRRVGGDDADGGTLYSENLY